MTTDTPGDLQQHLVDAHAVVVGTVSSVTMPETAVTALSAPPEQMTRPITEHDPEWREATIQVRSVEKGEVGQQATVYFPASMDVAWYYAPKLHAGQAGVYVLHQQEIPELQRTGLVLLHPEDYQPPEQLPHIQALLQSEH